VSTKCVNAIQLIENDRYKATEKERGDEEGVDPFAVPLFPSFYLSVCVDNCKKALLLEIEVLQRLVQRLKERNPRRRRTSEDGGKDDLL
jgi:hypothetical protein